MHESLDKTILCHFKDDSLAEFCMEALTGHRVTEFSPNLFPEADVVLTDSGIKENGIIPGYVPVVLFISDEDPFPESYYTRECDSLVTRDQFISEVQYVSGIAALGREAGLQDKRILNTDILEELSRLGTLDMVVNGLRRFMKNTTLQLNECRSMAEREEFEDIRLSLHTVKGNAATLGGEQLAAACNWMEELLMSENYSNFDDKLKLAYTLLASFSFMSNGWYQE